MDSLNRMLEMSKSHVTGNANDQDNQLYVSPENANRTIYLADLPKGTSYLEISDFLQNKVGVSSQLIQIKR